MSDTTAPEPERLVSGFAQMVLKALVELEHAGLLDTGNVVQVELATAQNGTINAIGNPVVTALGRTYADNPW
jgi:hypothetical protein